MAYYLCCLVSNMNATMFQLSSAWAKWMKVVDISTPVHWFTNSKVILSRIQMSMFVVLDSGNCLGLKMTPVTVWANDDPAHQYMPRQTEMNVCFSYVFMLYQHVNAMNTCCDWQNKVDRICLNISCHSKLLTYWNLQMSPKFTSVIWVSAVAVDALELTHQIISTCNIDSPPWIWICLKVDQIMILRFKYCETLVFCLIFFMLNYVIGWERPKHHWHYIPVVNM